MDWFNRGLMGNIAQTTYYRLTIYIYLFSAFWSYLLDTHDMFDMYITYTKLLFNLRLIVASWTFE